MAQDRTESSRVTISYGSFIIQFQPDIIKSILKLERTYTKMCKQKMSILFNGICRTQTIILNVSANVNSSLLHLFAVISNEFQTKIFIQSIGYDGSHSVEHILGYLPLKFYARSLLRQKTSEESRRVQRLK